jgi:hypothetical protein
LLGWESIQDENTNQMKTQSKREHKANENTKRRGRETTKHVGASRMLQLMDACRN